MTTLASPYCRVLVQPASTRTTVTSHGNEVLDILASSRANHKNKYNIAWWGQSSLQCYTPAPHFKPYHSILEGGNAAEAVSNGGGTLISFPDNNLSQSPYPLVTWKRTSGNNTARSVPPDGDPGVNEIELMTGGAKVGSTWSFSTSNLGDRWNNGLGAKKSGQLPLNGGVAFVIHRGVNDTPQEIPDPDPVSYTGDADINSVLAALQAQQQQETTAVNQGRSGDIRCIVGSIWSVILPGDHSSPRFEKKNGRNSAGGINWDTLYTFDDVKPNEKDGIEEYIVSFVVVAGRIAVAIGKEIAGTAFVYTEAKPGKNGGLKTLSFDPAPAIVSGVEGGNPVWFGIRRVGWNNFAQFFSTLNVQDTAIPGVNGTLSASPEGTLYAIGYQPALSPGMFTQCQQVSPTVLQYAITLTATPDDREPCAVKWVLFRTPRTTSAGTPTYIDYGPAVKSFTETGVIPDFSGARGNRGSDGKVSLVFDVYGLDKIAKENNTNWRNDLSAYSDATFVLGNLMSDKTMVEAVRQKGFLWNPESDTQGFHDSTFTVEIADPGVRLREPSTVIDKRFAPLDIINPQNPSGIWGYDGIRYILGKAIDQRAASNLSVYMPTDWPPIFNTDAMVLATGNLPQQDAPLWNPPYGKYPGEWIRDIAVVDFAALYPMGDAWIYGQYDQIAKGLPTIPLYDGTDANGHPVSSMTDQQINFTVTKAKSSLDSSHDYNKYVVWGQAPGGADGGGPDPAQFGVPLLEGSITDFNDVAQTWERCAPPIQNGRFYTQAFIDRYLAKIRQLSLGKRPAMFYSATLPFCPVYPAGSVPTYTGSNGTTFWWGYSILVNGGDDVRVRGKVLRIVKMNITGDFMKKKVNVELSLVENLG